MRRPEASTECGLGLGQTNFRAGELGGKALNEVIHDVPALENGYRRQYTEGVGSQQNNSLRMIPARTVGDVGITGERIGKARVLGDGAVAQIQLLGIRILDGFARQRRHVLDDGAGHGQRCRDHRLGVLVEIDQLRVAAVFQV